MKPYRRLLSHLYKLSLFFPECPHRRFIAGAGHDWPRTMGVLGIPIIRPGRGVLGTTIRCYSTSVETIAGEKPFDRACLQSISVKPLVLDGVDAGALEEEEEKWEDLGSEKGGNLEDLGVVEVKGREESEVEKEAWRLLNRAVVKYCGSPVGTVAADDPAMANQMLNYDQVFIRDFVPSALAFLLKGEGEIVRNFLLHTLQLQVKISAFFWLSNRFRLFCALNYGCSLEISIIYLLICYFEALYILEGCLEICVLFMN